MKVFVSSLIGGFEEQRQAVQSAITTLRHEPVMAEDFGAQPNSPQIACLQGLRKSDVVVLILGEGYGAVQAGSGLSATHEEYLEARDSKMILAFVQQGVTPDPRQAAFINEVQNWEGGFFRGGFSSVDDLQQQVTRSLHDVTLANAVGPVDEQALIAAAESLIPEESRNSVVRQSISVGISGGPIQRILRPAEIEDKSLASHLLQEALFGAEPIFDQSAGNQPSVDGDGLTIKQNEGALVRLNEHGFILIRLPLENRNDVSNRGFSGSQVIIQETVSQRITRALGYASQLLDHIDRTEKITHVAISASISSGEYQAWRTEQQHAASPNTVSFGYGNRERSVISVLNKRSMLRIGREQITDDFVVMLRRQFSADG